MLRAHWSCPEQAWANFKQVIAPWCKERFAEGQTLELEFRLHEDAKTDRQRRYLHGVIFKEISQQVSLGGSKYDLKVWKEHFRERFLGFRTVTFINPLTGKRYRRRVRVSTEDLGVKGYSNYIDRVTAFAVTELGVQFSCPTFKQYESMNVDPDTGEILP